MKFDQLIIQADGGSRGNPGPAGYGAVVLAGKDRQVLARRAGFLGVATNNVAEYSGLIAGLKAAGAINPRAKLLVELDSKLVVQQMSGAWKIKHADMQQLALEAREVLGEHQVEFRWIPREKNSLADALANRAMDEQGDFAEDLWREDKVETPPVATPTPQSPQRLPLHTTIYLVRHGHTPMTVAGQFSGSSDLGPELNELGWREVKAAAQLVKDLHASERLEPSREWHSLLASPMLRTQQTADALAMTTGLEISTNLDLAEVNFGDWHGLTAAAIEEGWPGQLRQWFADPTRRAPGRGGESLSDVADRVWPILLDLGQRAGGRPCVVAAHSVVIRAAVGRAMDVGAQHWARIRVLPGSVSVIRLGAGVPDIPLVGQLPLLDD